MTRNELIQGAIVRIMIVGVPLFVVLMMSLFRLDVIEVQGIPIPYLSLISIMGIMYFIASRLRMDHWAVLWGGTIALFVVAMMQLDQVTVPLLDIKVRFMSLLGIVSLQYPLAVWLIGYYQRLAKKTEERIEIKVNGIIERAGR